MTKRSSNGFAGRTRLALEISVAAFATLLLMRVSSPGPWNPLEMEFWNTLSTGLSSSLSVPFSRLVLIPFGLFFIFVGALIIAGAGNSVNLTDGLDGLALVPVMIAAATFGLISYVVGNVNFADYLKRCIMLPAPASFPVLCGALIGAGLGFLWFNAPPAMIFMGDTGSLALGGCLGTIAVATKHEIVLAIVGGLFVLETLSVIIQVVSFKWTGKRVFRMAPLHHHYEQKGWKDPPSSSASGSSPCCSHWRGSPHSSCARSSVIERELG